MEYIYFTILYGFCHMSTWICHGYPMYIILIFILCLLYMSLFLYFQSLYLHSSVCMICHFSRVWLFATLYTVAGQTRCPWDFPGKNTGEGCQSFLQWIFPTQGSNPYLSCLLYSVVFIVQISHLYITTGKTVALTIMTFVKKGISLHFNMLGLALPFFQGGSIF